jgi:subtilase family serine protease
MRKARIAALAAGAGALAVAVAAAVAPAPSASSAESAASGTLAGTSPRITLKPGIIRLPMRVRQAPSSTAQCEQSFNIACYQPGQIRAAYGLPTLYARGITGKGMTIAIVDSFGSPTIRTDLAAFDKQFGYPAPPSFRIVTPAGAIPKYNENNSDMTGWAGETTLDVEYAHALAPGANIVLVETPVSETEGVTGFPQIVKAEKWVLNHGLADVISQSFGATEQTFTGLAQLQPLRAAYKEAQKDGVTVLAASGDAGPTDYGPDEVTYYTHPVTSWPDSDPLVTAVGGTQLKLSGGKYTSVVWNDTYNGSWNEYFDENSGPSPFASGGGKSIYFGRPSWQDSVKSVVGTRRGVPDISMSASCNGSVEIYSTFPDPMLPPGWSLICGTSEATPEFAAIVALADQVAGHPLGVINPTLYALSAAKAPGIVDVTSGNNTVSFFQGAGNTEFTVKGSTARKGYDLATGVGTIYAPDFVYELAGVPVP